MSLKDKASKLNFASLVNQAAASTDPKQPKTAPGAMMAFANDTRSELLRENEELRGRAARSDELEARLNEVVEDLRSWEGVKPARLLDPREIRRSAYANRHESSFLGDDFERLVREIGEAGGNVQPIKIRPVAKSGGKGEGAAYEIVFGHRRHEACRRLGLPVLAVVDNLDDRSLFVEMDRENRERADLSPWEQGVMYARALDQGLFTSNRQLAAAVGIDLSNLGKSLVLARLPSEIVAAFATPLDIQLRWAPLLNRALEQDEAALKQRARTLGKGHRTNPKAVLAALLAPEGGKAADEKEDTQVLDASGKKAASLTFDSQGRATLKISRRLSPGEQRDFAKVVEEFVASL